MAPLRPTRTILSLTLTAKLPTPTALALTQTAHSIFTHLRNTPCIHGDFNYTVRSLLPAAPQFKEFKYAATVGEADNAVVMDRSGRAEEKVAVDEAWRVFLGGEKIALEKDMKEQMGVGEQLREIGEATERLEDAVGDLEETVDDRFYNVKGLIEFEAERKARRNQNGHQDAGLEKDSKDLTEEHRNKIEVALEKLSKFYPPVLKVEPEPKTESVKPMAKPIESDSVEPEYKSFKHEPAESSCVDPELQGLSLTSKLRLLEDKATLDVEASGLFAEVYAGLNNLQDTNEQLRFDIMEREEGVEILKLANTKLKKQNKIFADELAGEKKQNVYRGWENTELSKELEEMLCKLAENGDPAGLKDENTDLKQQILRLEEDVEHAEAETAVSEHREMELAQQFGALKLEHDALKQRSQDLEKVNDENSGEKSQLAEELAGLKDEMTAGGKREVELAQQISRLNDENDALKHRNEDLAQLYAKAGKEHDVLKQRSGDLEQEHASVKNENADLAKQIAALDVESCDLSNELAGAKAENSALTQREAELAERVSALNDEYVAFKKNEYSAITQELAGTKDENAALKQRELDRSQRSTAVTLEYDTAMRQSSTFAKEIASVKDENSTLKQCRLNMALENYQRWRGLTIAEHIAQNRSQTIDKLNTELDAAQQKLGEHGHTNSVLLECNPTAQRVEVLEKENSALRHGIRVLSRKLADFDVQVETSKRVVASNRALAVAEEKRETAVKLAEQMRVQMEEAGRAISRQKMELGRRDKVVRLQNGRLCCEVEEEEEKPQQKQTLERVFVKLNKAVRQRAEQKKREESQE